LIPNSRKSPDFSWSPSVFREISKGNYHCQEFASLKPTNFVARNNALVNL